MDGILLIDKPSGMTSHDIVREVRRILKMKAVGHAGTLDPLATGLLVILLGEGTHLSQGLLNRDKWYHIKVKLGVETETWDTDGKVIQKKNTGVLSPRQVVSEVERLEGDLVLPVPIFSAVKRGGKKLYEYAREGKQVEIPLREMKFYNVSLESVGSDFVEVSLSCSKGSFIRSWAYELGRQLGVGACVEQLRRLASLPYKVEAAITLEKLKKEGLAPPYFTSFQDCVSPYKAFTVSGKSERLMKNGQIPHELSQRLVYSQKQANGRQESIPVRVMSGTGGNLLGLLEVRPFDSLKIKKIFKTSYPIQAIPWGT